MDRERKGFKTKTNVQTPEIKKKTTEGLIPEEKKHVRKFAKMN